MRNLLIRWAGLEPERCRLNLNWQPANGGNNYYIAIQTDDSEGWQLVYSDSERNYYFPHKNEALALIQYAVQEAIVSRGWRYGLEYFPITKTYEVKVFHTQGRGSSLTEAILSAYLQALESEER